MSTKFRDKKKNYKIEEENYSHPRHEPYRRDRHNWLLLEDTNTTMLPYELYEDFNGEWFFQVWDEIIHTYRDHGPFGDKQEAEDAAMRWCFQND